MTGQEIRARLKAVGKTQNDLAALLGKDRSTVARLLNGRTRLLVDVSAQIEAYLAPLEARAGAAGGVRETATPFAPAPSPFASPPARPRRKKLSPEEIDALVREIGELAAVLRNAPRLTEMTDDELLGYDAPR